MQLLEHLHYLVNYEYYNYIIEAKKEATELSRLEKIKPNILKGSGLHDKYKNC